MRKYLLQHRKKLGLSQQQVADKIGMTRSNYAHIERGRHEPSIDQMEAIAVALEIKSPTIIFFKNFCDETYQKDVANCCTNPVKAVSSPDNECKRICNEECNNKLLCQNKQSTTREAG